MNIHQTLVTYVPAQDCCLMYINSHADDELRLWFTQAAHAGSDASPERVMVSSDSAAAKLLGCWALAGQATLVKTAPGRIFYARATAASRQQLSPRLAATPSPFCRAPESGAIWSNDM